MPARQQLEGQPPAPARHVEQVTGGGQVEQHFDVIGFPPCLFRAFAEPEHFQKQPRWFGPGIDCAWRRSNHG